MGGHGQGRAQAATIVILTGSGISKESGIPTFRDASGLWQRYRPEELATPEAFGRDPDLVHAFYNARRRLLHDPQVAPNAAHHALARLERDWPGRVVLVTQNVDDLHERAGSAAPLHMHGRLDRVRCVRCEHATGWRGDLTTGSRCDACGEAALRPDVVWFGEMPRHLEQIEAALIGCGLFVAIGTSGHVRPASDFVRAAAGRARTVEINLEPSINAALFDDGLYGPATEMVPDWVARTLDPWA